MEDSGESRVLKQLGVMAHEDVDITRLHVLIGPDHRMIAAHLDDGIRRVRRLIHMGQHVNVGTGRLVVGAPLLLLHHE